MQLYNNDKHCESAYGHERFAFFFPKRHRRTICITIQCTGRRGAGAGDSDGDDDYGDNVIMLEPTAVNCSGAARERFRCRCRRLRCRCCSAAPHRSDAVLRGVVGRSVTARRAERAGRRYGAAAAVRVYHLVLPPSPAPRDDKLDARRANRGARNTPSDAVAAKLHP